jgi:hypothetical protein
MTKVVNLYKEPYDIYIGRGSKWGNPFTTNKDKETLASEIVETSEEAISKYKEYVLNTPDLMQSLDELEGKTLGCFCKPKPCHGDVLLELLSQKKFVSIYFGDPTKLVKLLSLQVNPYLTFSGHPFKDSSSLL